MDGLDRLISTDFLGRCRTRSFCYACAAPFCQHCCGSPADHRRLHHGGQGPAPAQVNLVCGTPCILSEDFNGSRFSSAKIQRFRRFSEQWIPIIPQAHEDFRLKKSCRNCHHRLKSGSDYCSVLCRANLKGGNAQAMALQLAHFAQVYNQPVLRHNRFCRICFLAYSSQSCPDHIRHHEEDPAAAAGLVAAGTIISVEEFDGLPVVEDHELPPNYVDQVQGIHLEDGRIYYPIHGRGIDHVAAFENDPEAHPCARPHCPEVFRGPALFCSLRCRRQA